MNKKIIIWGAKGHAKVLWELFSHYGDHVVALFDNDETIISLSPQKPIPIYHGESGFFQWLLANHPDKNEYYGTVAIGGSRGRERATIHKFLSEHHIHPIKAIHPTAFIANDTRIGTSCQILAHCTIASEAIIGDYCIVNTSASIDHESELGIAVHIGPGAKIAGMVRIGNYSFIGTGAIILPRIVVGQNVIVGAGAVVIHDVPDNCTIVGNPAKVIRRNKPN